MLEEIFSSICGSTLNFTSNNAMSTYANILSSSPLLYCDFVLPRLGIFQQVNRNDEDLHEFENNDNSNVFIFFIKNND